MFLPVDEGRAGQLPQHRLHPAADVEPPVVPGTGVGHGGEPRHCQANVGLLLFKYFSDIIFLLSCTPGCPALTATLA